MTLHAAHPIPRRYLRNSMQNHGRALRLQFVGEVVDEKMFIMTEGSEFLDNLQETFRRVNELLAPSYGQGVQSGVQDRVRVVSKRDGEATARGEVAEDV